jgi:hypothetical protein
MLMYKNYFPKVVFLIKHSSQKKYSKPITYTLYT